MNNKLKLAIAAASGLIAGGAVGYIVGARIANNAAVKALTEFEEAMKADIVDYKQQLSKTGPYATVQGAAAMLLPEKHQGLENEQPTFSDEYDSAPPAPTVNEGRDAEPEADASDVADPDAKAEFGSDFMERFRNRAASEVERGVTFHGTPLSEVLQADDDSDEPFVTVRDAHGPYTISMEEYMDEDGEKPYTNTEVTWFEGDDVLVDVLGTEIPDKDGNLGTKFRDQFGRGSKDPSVVYLRNERLELDFEVTKDERTYLEGVLKILPQEKAEASMYKPRKMRESDDN